MSVFSLKKFSHDVDEEEDDQNKEKVQKCGNSRMLRPTELENVPSFPFRRRVSSSCQRLIQKSMHNCSVISFATQVEQTPAWVRLQAQALKTELLCSEPRQWLTSEQDLYNVYVYITVISH